MYKVYCWSPHDDTKIQTTKLLILMIFYFNDVKEQLKNNVHTNLCFGWVLGLTNENA